MIERRSIFHRLGKLQRRLGKGSVHWLASVGMVQIVEGAEIEPFTLTEARILKNDLLALYDSDRCDVEITVIDHGTTLPGHRKNAKSTTHYLQPIRKDRLLRYIVSLHRLDSLWLGKTVDDRKQQAARKGGIWLDYRETPKMDWRDWWVIEPGDDGRRAVRAVRDASQVWRGRSLRFISPVPGFVVDSWLWEARALVWMLRCRGVHAGETVRVERGGGGLLLESGRDKLRRVRELLERWNEAPVTEDVREACADSPEKLAALAESYVSMCLAVERALPREGWVEDDQMEWIDPGHIIPQALRAGSTS